MEEWTDSHNHLHDPRIVDMPREVEAARAAGVVRCVVNATRETDWETVTRCCATAPEMLRPAYGIHPWHATSANDGWISRLRQRLLADPAASIGECGLDLWISEPSLAIQLPVFQSQLDLARELDRPVSVHCLKAWGPMLDLLERTTPSAGFLMHSYGGSIEMARRLLNSGARFSFSGYFLHERKAAVREVFRKLPLERILLETDAPDMIPPQAFLTEEENDGINRPRYLPSIGLALAGILEMPPSELAEITNRNAAELFRW